MCISKLTNDIFRDCKMLGKKGVESESILINFEDVDFSASTVNGAKITNLSLKSGTTGYRIESYKQLGGFSNAAVASTDGQEGFTHSITGRIEGSTLEASERLKELQQGRFIQVVKTIFKGSNQEDEFKVLGFSNGLELSESTIVSNENNGNILFTMTTLDGNIEPYMYNVLLMGDSDSTKEAFDGLFA